MRLVSCKRLSFVYLASLCHATFAPRSFAELAVPSCDFIGKFDGVCQTQSHQDLYQAELHQRDIPYLYDTCDLRGPETYSSLEDTTRRAEQVRSRKHNDHNESIT